MRDLDVRTAVRQRLDSLHAYDDSTIVVEEMGIWNGSVRIDIAVINGEMTGIEIKSDKDTLERLPFQAKLYSDVFDKIELVVGNRHIAAATAHVPAWWGVLRAQMFDGVVRINREREARENPCRDPLMIVRLLDKDELLGMLHRRGLDKGFRSQRISTLQALAIEHINLPELSSEIRAILKSRPTWLGKLRSS